MRKSLLVIVLLILFTSCKVVLAASTTVSSWNDLATAVNSGNYDTIKLKDSSSSTWVATSTIRPNRDVTIATDSSNTGTLIIQRGTTNALFEVLSVRLSLDGQNKGLTIDGSYSSQTKPIITVSNGGQLIVTKVSLKNNNSNTSGGAISVSNSSLTLHDANIGGNKANFGGGVYISGESSSSSILNTYITDNSSVSGSGGGIYAYGNIQIENSNILNNTAATYGGGIMIKTKGTIKNTNVTNNVATANAGGAIRIDGEATITGGEIKNNKAGDGGAGIDFSNSRMPVAYSNVTMNNNMVGTNEVNIFPDLDSPNNVDWKKDSSLKIEEIDVRLLKSYPRNGTGELAPHTGATQGMTITDKFILMTQWTDNDDPTKIHVFDKNTLELKNTIVIDAAVNGYTFGHANDLAYDKKTGFVYVYTYYKASNGKVQVAKFKVNNAGQMTDLSLFDTPRAFSGMAFDNDHDQILLMSGKKVYIYDRDWNLKSSFDTPTNLITQGIAYWKGYVYFACYEGGVSNQYQTIFNFNERHSNLIYMYDLQGNLVKSLYIPYTAFDGELEDVDFLDNGEMIMNYNYDGISLIKSTYPVQIKSIVVDKKPNKLQYYQKMDQLDLTGLVLGVTLNNEDKTTVSSLNDIVVQGFDNSVLGTQTVNLVYKGKTVSIQVEVVAPKNPETGGTALIVFILVIAVGMVGLLGSKRFRKLYKV